MALRSHRKLNVEQLINLAQVYWDDPGKLLEIVEATKARKDPAAQLLLGAVTNRLNRLRSDPVLALGEAVPDLAALIAARLGTPKIDNPVSEAEPEQEKRVPPGGQEGSSTGRRLWPWAALALLALAGGATWWFWPRADEREVATAPREIGVEIQQGGLVAVEEEKKSGAAAGLPPGRRRPEILAHPERDPRALEHADEQAKSRDAARARIPESRVRDASDAKDAAGPRSPPDLADAAGAAAGRSGGRSVPDGGATAAAEGARTTAAATASGRADGSVTIEEALLQCYLSERRPEACAPRPSRGGGGGGSPDGGAGSGRGVGDDAGPPAAAPSTSAEARSGARGSAPPSGARPRRESGTAGNRDAGAGSRGSSGGSPSQPGSADSAGARAGQRGSARASAGAESKADAPQKATPPQAPKSAAVQGEPDADCPDTEPDGRVVFIFDASVSMGLPLGLDPAEEDRLDDGVRRRDPEARREYRALLWEAGPKRMGRAQSAFADAAAELPETVELGLVVFQECLDIRKVGVFDGASRGSAIDYVQRLIPHGRTPLAQSLLAASDMLGEGKSSIVLLTDGIEFCSGDPCAVAEQMKSARPGTPVHIVDVTGQARTACVSEITGGRSYAPSEADDLARVIRNAFRGAAAHCGATAAGAKPSAANP